MSFPDSRALPAEVRARAAENARNARNVRLPPLGCWNDSPCPEHRETGLTRGCARCGISPHRHQRTGAAWLYFAGRGLLADQVGVGKTAQIALVLALCKETGELSYDNRAVIICRAAAIGQWARELRRMLPGVQVISADGPPDERLRAYLGGWEVCVVSDRTLSPARGRTHSRDGDVERLRQRPVGIVVYDDIDAMRNGTTRTAYAVKQLAGEASRVYGVHGTPLQKRLTELYSFLEPVGGREALGPPARFRQRYVRRTRIYLYVNDRRDPTGRTRKRVSIWKDAGIQERLLPEFRALAAPLILRRTVRDLDDSSLPAVQVSEVWLEPLPAQRDRYEELRQGVLRRLREGGAEVTRVEAGAAFTRARQICDGLAALDGPGGDVSAKLDWVMDKLTGDLDGEKAVVFCYFRPVLAALAARLEAEGIGHVLMWSEETGKRERDARIARFTGDPACRVLAGTTTIETSLNLQAAGHLIALSTIQNPARMEQVLGRVRRTGSRHAAVILHQLLLSGTVEEAFPEMLRAEQNMADAVLDAGDGSAAFSQYTPRQVLRIIAEGQLPGSGG